MLSIILFVVCKVGDSRLVISQGLNTTIFAVNASNHREVCQYVTNNEIITVIACNTSWHSLIEGRVEVCSSSKVFGTVCDNRWDSYEAKVVCTQLNSNAEGIVLLISEVYF